MTQQLYNFRTGILDSAPEDGHDDHSNYIPQFRDIQKLYKAKVAEGMSPRMAAIVVLEQFAKQMER